ncbi:MULTISPECIES: EamA family transporter [Rhodococcus]|uniref:EamA family transporter n=1 Tax=Rhodococcus oxybenzonivorans TaxID=1990687 RepID=A0AAE4V3Q5_9NOCA|nr:MULTISPECIES: EamA family transporter [Rhodococcus]MDV7245076.1 EamA family transporter [Rhodococcus oxybenzonivorans]MDV7267973.1 EamA family transporter [Rhodococcus oxybenzonivorans]MDV7272641.1 EamA family transporter [Rhodococcus oxybenzonivorans]MDV7336101.1 EamA family transporter [Rhodococcus oxybenzonivorans]MDV7342788.1 EamA family transporter [Rhodococcus oxybenzonivorans]
MTETSPSQLVPVLSVLGSVLSVQFGAAFGSTLFDTVGASGAVALRLTVAALILGILVRPRWRRWTRPQREGIIALGLALAVMNSAFYEALARLPLGTTVTIEFLGPLTLAAVLSRRLRDGVWVVAALAGVLMLGLRDTGSEALDAVGVAFALTAGAAWAGYIIAGSHLAATVPSADGLAGASIVAAVLTLPLGVISGGTALFDPHTLAVGAAVALLSSVIPYTLELRALQVMSKKVFAILIALEPAAATLAGVLVLGQVLGLQTLAAIALVVAAGIGSVLSNR